MQTESHRESTVKVLRFRFKAKTILRLTTKKISLGFYHSKPLHVNSGNQEDESITNLYANPPNKDTIKWPRKFGGEKHIAYFKNYFKGFSSSMVFCNTSVSFGRFFALVARQFLAMFRGCQTFQLLMLVVSVLQKNQINVT